jgi:hypothetical protein
MSRRSDKQTTKEPTEGAKMTSTTSSRWRAAIATTVAIAVAALAAAPARADFGLDGGPTVLFHAPQNFGVFDVIAEQEPPLPVSVTQAGGHPDLSVIFKVNQVDLPAFGGLYPTERLRDVVTDMPAGFYGNPQSRPSCTWQQFSANRGYCDVNAQVGMVVPTVSNNPGDGILYKNPLPIYNIRTDGDETAVLAFSFGNVVTKMTITPRTDGDYGLRATISGLTQTGPIFASRCGAIRRIRSTTGSAWASTAKRPTSTSTRTRSSRGGGRARRRDCRS